MNTHGTQMFLAFARLRYSKYLPSHRLELNNTDHAQRSLSVCMSGFLRLWRGGRDNNYRTPMNTDEHR